MESSLASTVYFNELLSYSAERLSKEPDLLRADQERIRRQIVDTAVGKYQTFLHAAETIDAIHDDIGRVEAFIAALEKELPELTQHCTDLMAAAKDVFQRKEANRALLGQHATLLDLLELPQVMETCVRNGNYEEALDLEAFVLKLSTVLADVRVVKLIQAECAHVTEFMKEQILRRLSGAIQLPECLKAVGYLRRLGLFTEAELRRHFLSCRGRWIQEALDDLDESSPYEHLKRLTDIFRLHVFDVVMQYRAVFSDESPGPSPSGPKSGSAAPWEPSFVASWAQGMMEAYLESLQEGLPRVRDGASLSSLLEQCMSCGMSLGRIGLDLRPLLPPLFEGRVLSQFAAEVAAAPEAYRTALDQHRWLALSTAASNGAAPPSDDTDLSPPAVLLEFAPLGVFLNRILAALNELRHLAPLSLRHAVHSAVQQALEQAAEHTRMYYAARQLGAVEVAGFAAFCEAFVSVLAPFVGRCVVAVYAGQPMEVGPAVGAVRELLKADELQAVIRRRALARQSSANAKAQAQAQAQAGRAPSGTVTSPVPGAEREAASAAGSGSAKSANGTPALAGAAAS